MFKEVKEETLDLMDKNIASLKNQLAKVRTGRATSAVLDGIKVSYYGTPTPLNQLGKISTPEARILQIQPFDRNLISEIEKAIFNSNLGLTPSNDGNMIRLPFPQLTEEKRKDLVKGVKKTGEDAKIKCRNVRREQNEIIKKAVKNKDLSEDESKKYQDEIQTITDNYIKKIYEIMVSKEKELMTI